MEKNKYVLCYTRQPMEDILYSPKLAYSMHLAYSEDGIRFEPLNRNSGVLFAKATDREDGTMGAKSLKCPYLFAMKDGRFGVAAIRTEANGEDDPQSKGKALLFITEDLMQYREEGLIELNEAAFLRDLACRYEEDRGVYVISWKEEDGRWFYKEAAELTELSATSAKEGQAVEFPDPKAEIEGIVPRNIVAVPREIAERLQLRLTAPVNVSVEVPEIIEASSLEELGATKVRAVYSDGTFSYKRVDWDLGKVDFSTSGTYEITGTVHQDHYEFPVAINRADPCIIRWKEKYYFIATNDADRNHTLYIREADTIPGLVDAEEVLLLDTKTYAHVGGLLWAPEFHIVGEDLYIFHAATPGEFHHEECHVMKLKRGGDPVERDDWSMPSRVLKKDGSYLCEAGKTISLDMTCFPWMGEYYVAWSQRQFKPVDTGAWIYIAKVDAENPWRLVTDPVLLTKPDYGWANNHTFVDEGPFALITDNKLFLTFSSAAVNATYVVGLLTAEHGADLLDPNNWTKLNYPLLTSRSVEGEFGPGHNAYVADEDGNIWNVYHARSGVDGPRSTGIRRVHFDIDGYPVLDLTEEKDLAPHLKKVRTRLEVKPTI